MPLKIVDATATVTRDWQGVKLTIARRKTSSVAKKMDKLLTERGETTTASLSDVEREEIVTRAMAGTVLVGWENFQIDGEDIPYTEENAEELLLNDEDTLEYVSIISNNLNLFVQARKEEQVKKP
jgi:hypothetical protein